MKTPLLRALLVLGLFFGVHQPLTAQEQDRQYNIIRSNMNTMGVPFGEKGKPPFKRIRSIEVTDFVHPFDKESSLIVESVYSYDEKGNFVEYLQYKDGKTSSALYKRKNSDWLKLRYFELGSPNITLYIVDDEGKIVEYIFWNLFSGDQLFQPLIDRFKVTYDSSGRVIRHEGQSSRIDFVYNDAGDIIKSTFFEQRTFNKMQSENNAIFDAKGKKIAEQGTVSYYDSPPLSFTSTIGKFNQYDDWLQYEYRLNGNEENFVPFTPKSIVKTREIDYWDE